MAENPLSKLPLIGQVLVAFALGAVDDAEFGRTVEALARADVAIMTNGPGPVPATTPLD